MATRNSANELAKALRGVEQDLLLQISSIEHCLAEKEAKLAQCKAALASNQARKKEVEHLSSAAKASALTSKEVTR